MGSFLQRLFSTFPNSWPGVGLFLLRLCLAAALLDSCLAGISNPTETIAFVQESIAAAGAVVLIAGLWTPVVASIVSLDEAWIAYATYGTIPADSGIHIFLAVLAASMAMLGPGAWSIDARLFGRKRFDIHPAGGRKPSL